MISEEDVKKIAKLAHLSVDEEELKGLAKELSSILDYINQLNSVDTSNVEPLSHVHGSTNVLREDVVTEPLAVEELLKIVPDQSGRFIRVPIIVE